MTKLSYENVRKALEIMECIDPAYEPPKIIYDEYSLPMNRKQRRIKASKDRRNGKSKDLV